VANRGVLFHRGKPVGPLRPPIVLHAARTFTPGDYDLVIVGDNGDEGLRLAWDHLPRGDEYELVRWGTYRHAT
jgi:hypothetical protein